MGGSATAAVMLSAFTAMLKIAIISVVGIVGAKYPKIDPILPQGHLRSMARLSSLVLLPCLTVYSLGSSVNAALLGRIGNLVFFSLVSGSIGYSFTRFFGRLVFEKGNENLFIAVQVAVGCPNGFTLPILVMETLCEEPRFNSDFNGDSAECATQSTAMIFVYCIAWHFLYWSYGYPLLKTIGDKSNDSYIHESISVAKLQQSLLSLIDTWDITNKEKRSAIIKWISLLILTPCIIAVLIGVFIAIIPPLQNVLFTRGASLRFVGSAIQTIGEPVNCLNTIIMAASLAHCDMSAFRRMFHSCMDNFLFKITDESTPDENNFEKIDTVNVLYASEEMEVVPVNEEPDAVVAVEQTEDKKPEMPKWNSILCLLVTRLMLVPLIMLVVIALCTSIGIVGEDQKLVRFLVLIESASPSAQLVIVSLNALGKSEVAADMAYLYTIMYILSILTITLWTTIAISLYY